MESIIEKIKTFEDALKATGRPNIPEFLELPEDLRAYHKAQYKMYVIVEALNEGWKPDWNDGVQKKWTPWFSITPGRFVFRYADYRYQSPRAGGSYSFYFRNYALAEYCGTQFIEDWKNITVWQF